MKILILICMVLTVAVAQEPTLSCRYINFDFNESYQCELTIHNPNGFDNVTEIGGTHLEGFSNENVTMIYNVDRFNTFTTIIPRIICETFPNIENFDITGTQVGEINDNTFSGCSRMRQLHIYYNRISSISENAFSNLPELSYINLGDNLLTTLPENVFANQQNLADLNLNYNSFNNLPNGLFRPLESLEYLNIGSNYLSMVNSEWFTTNSNLIHLYLSSNRINLTANNFVGSLHSLQILDLAYNGISEIPLGAFAGLTNLVELQLYGNNIRELQENVFADLSELVTLDIDSNPIEIIDDRAVQGLGNLFSLSMSSCRIRDLSTISFDGLRNLSALNLNFNEIEMIPPGIFASMPNLSYIGLGNNRIKTVRRDSFGTLTGLRSLDLDGNFVNAIDRAIIDDAVNLETLFFDANLCASNYFGNFQNSRATYLPMLETCFRNLRYIVDTTTEGDGIYSFFEGQQPGIVLRVESDNEIQIALTPFNFLWIPSIEIFIGSTNNTRSVIRINEETDVVTVPTPNIIQTNEGNDFRIIWANQNILVFRGNDIYPFMSYTMQHFVPVNFYGLRAVETRATWSVQPLDF